MGAGLVSVLTSAFRGENMILVVLVVSHIHPWTSLWILGKSQVEPAGGRKEWLITAVTLAGNCELGPVKESWGVRMQVVLREGWKFEEPGAS